MPKKTKPNPGAALVALRRTAIVTCAYCGKQSERPLRVGAAYCSRACKDAAYNQKRSELKVLSGGGEPSKKFSKKLKKGIDSAT